MYKRSKGKSSKDKISIPLSLPYDPPTNPEPIQVYISSDSVEFGPLRKHLQQCINAEYMYNKQRTNEEEEAAKFIHQGVVMKGLLVEGTSGESFDQRMKKLLDVSHIYVGIFGNNYSDPTRREYNYACKLGLPLLVYYFTVPPQKAKGTTSKVVQFLDKTVRSRNKLVIRGNYRKIEARKPNELIDIILSDLACTVADIAAEGITGRKMILESAPTAIIDAVLRARRTVFQ